MAEAALARRGPVGPALATGRDRLAGAGCDTPRLDAELLLAQALGVGREQLVIDRNEPMPEPAWERFEALLARREAREPVAYILGRKEFRRLTFAVDRRVLIPRPETELLVEVALALPAGGLVADVGTGSGAVALAVKDERPDLTVHGLDVDPGALDVARANAERLGLDVAFAASDLLDDGRYDAVLANLPYVAEGATLAPEIADYEPARALFAGPDGLDLIRRLVAAAAGRTGLLALEIGPEQAVPVAELMRGAGFGEVKVLRDLAGHDRVVVGRGVSSTDRESSTEAAAFERCMAVGGVAVFPSDTVYGLACDAQNRVAVERLYALKRRALDKPSAVMFFNLELALAALPELGPRTRSALERLMPGAVTALVGDPAGRFPLACGSDPATLGVRVPDLPLLHGVRWPVLQSSANLAGEPEARELERVTERIRRAADLVIDGGTLPGTASTVVDLREYESAGRWAIIRLGAVAESAVAKALAEPAVAKAPAGQFHFDPASYEAMIRSDIPVYDALQDELARATGSGARRVLELGTGTGETAGRLLDRHPGARLVGIDESAAMLGVARDRLDRERVTLKVRRIEDPLPTGPFDLVASALCVHHLPGTDKRELFARIGASLEPGGRFVLADVVVPVDPADAVTSLTPGFDHPSTVADQLDWLTEVGFEPRVTWQHRDLAVVVAEWP